MLEVVFGKSAAGSLAVAMGRRGRIGGSVSVAVLQSGGSELSEAELEQFQREAQERERRCWEQTVPLSGRREDILHFSLALSVGQIREAGIGPGREAALSLLMGGFRSIGADAVRESLSTARTHLSRLLERAAGGEAVRVWSSSNPDEACGLYWLMEQLRPLGLDQREVILVALPEWEERSDGTVIRRTSWGEVEPHQWGRLARRGERLPPVRMRAMADHWRQLQQENAPLRAVLNGRLASVPEDLYDPAILRELEAQGEEFQEAGVVGAVLGKYQFGIGDAWVAWRIERFIQKGLFEPVTDADPDGPIYRRTLRRCSAAREAFKTDGACHGAESS